MNVNKCLGCYQSLDSEPDLKESFYHSKCSRKLFGVSAPPRVDFGLEQMEELAKAAINRHLGLTGVQSKISVQIKPSREDAMHRLTLVGLRGDFILKPPSTRFPDMPVLEDVTMHLAESAGIKTAIHGLIPLKSGEIAYITRRFDRKKTKKKLQKIPVEDLCQLSGLLTERKYKTSMEKAGKIILKYSSNPGLDVVTFFDIALFSFLTGNADMHLKNFSLISTDPGEVSLAPAYDLLSTHLLPIQDPEEVALTINGKKARLTRRDFEIMGETLQIPNRAIRSSFQRLNGAIPSMKTILHASFLSPKLIENYMKLIYDRAEVLELEMDCI